MFSYTESVTIAASPGSIWTQFVDLERWWSASSADHVRVEILSANKRVALGARMDLEEHIGAIRSEAKTRVVSMNEGVGARWEGTAVYHYLGFRIPVEEGVEWHIAGMGELAIVSVRVWVYFPSGLAGRMVEWFATRFLKVEAIREGHSRQELESLKRLIESK